MEVEHRHSANDRILVGTSVALAGHLYEMHGYPRNGIAELAKTHLSFLQKLHDAAGHPAVARSSVPHVHLANDYTTLSRSPLAEHLYWKHGNQFPAYSRAQLQSMDWPILLAMHNALPHETPPEPAQEELRAVADVLSWSGRIRTAGSADRIWKCGHAHSESGEAHDCALREIARRRQQTVAIAGVKTLARAGTTSQMDTIGQAADELYRLISDLAAVGSSERAQLHGAVGKLYDAARRKA